MTMTEAQDQTIADYVANHGITAEVVRDRGAQTEDGWEHHAYVVRLTFDGRTLDTPWKQGYGIETSPSDTPELILNSLVDDAWSADNARDFEDWAGEYGYDTDSRKAYAMYEACLRTRDELVTFLGSADELERVAMLERL